MKAEIDLSMRQDSQKSCESRLMTYGCLSLIDESAHVVSYMMSLNVTVGQSVQTVTVTGTRYCTTRDLINAGQ